MSISKQEYTLRTLTKIVHKKWEVFIISRILHGLDDDEIEFVTQQLVRLPNGKRALTDLYFPQFNLHLEIDEPAHENQIFKDKKREQDIIQTTGHEFERIKIADVNGMGKDISIVRNDVDAFIKLVSELKLNAVEENRFIPWDWNNRYSSVPVIKRGYVSIQDNVVFLIQIEAMRCFGFKGKGWQRGAWKISDETDDVVWFPRLYKYGMWYNELTNDGKIINERAINNDGKESINKQIAEGKLHPERKHIVFAKARDALGFNLLRYVGSFKINFDKSTSDNIVFDRVSTEEAIRSIK